MRVIVCEGDGVRHLIRDGVDDHLDAESMYDGHKFLVEICHRAWCERHGLSDPLARADEEAVINEVEINREGPTAIRDRGRREATGGHIERHVPPVVHRWAADEPNLPHNLHPHMEGGIGILP